MGYIQVGAMPRKEGMERKDLLAGIMPVIMIFTILFGFNDTINYIFPLANAKIFEAQGGAINRVAKKSVKVVVVGNPANTNAWITSYYAPTIPKSQITCLTQLDQVPSLCYYLH